jgi:hypothetical protein
MQNGKNQPLETAPRRGPDYVAFAVGTAGTVLAIAGVVLSSICSAVCGLVLVGLALAYFWRR